MQSSWLLVAGKMNWRGLFEVGQDSGFVLPKIVCGAAPGCVFLTGYGTIRRHDLQAGETLLVNNGRFLAARITSPRPLYTVVKLGKTVLSSLLGGEGLGMRFVGPGEVYTQSHDFEDLVRLISTRLPQGAAGQGITLLGGEACKAGKASKAAPKAKAKAKATPVPKS